MKRELLFPLSEAKFVHMSFKMKHICFLNKHNVPETWKYQLEEQFQKRKEKYFSYNFQKKMYNILIKFFNLAIPNSQILPYFNFLEENNSNNLLW